MEIFILLFAATGSLSNRPRLQECDSHLQENVTYENKSVFQVYQDMLDTKCSEDSVNSFFKSDLFRFNQILIHLQI